MSKIRVHEEPTVVGEVDADPQSVARGIKGFVGGFFPQWVKTFTFAAAWLAMLPSLMALIAPNPLSGMLSGAGLVLASSFAVVAYPTYSPPWRTLAWGLLLSTTIVFFLLLIPSFPFKLFVVLIPTGLLVAARVNMNWRRLRSAR